MKLAMKLVALMFGVLFLANIADAETPREQLKQMVEQLQKNPTDNALREKIIRIAQEIKPAPAMPDEAERFEGRAQFAFTNAKLLTDYLDAAKEYEKAVAVAPWVAGYYSDLCTIYEKAEKYAEAKKSCEFFLASSPSALDASVVRKRIAGLEFAIEKAMTARVALDASQREYLSGRWQFLGGNDFDRASHSEFRMDGNTLVQENIYDQNEGPYVAGHRTTTRWNKVSDKVFEVREMGHKFIIQFDGDTIIQTYESGSKSYFKRQ